MELICAGKGLIGTKLSEFCAYALLALEVLIHPRALPLVDYSAINDSFSKAHSNFHDGYAVDRNKSNPFESQQVGYDTPESDDDLCHKWLEDGSGPDLSLAKEGAKQPEEPSGISRDTISSSIIVTKQPEEPSVISRDNDQKLQTVPHMTSPKKSPDVEMTAIEDENVTKSDRPVEYAMQLQDPRSVVVDPVSENTVPDNEVPHTGNQMESNQEASISKDNESANPSNQTPMISDLKRDEVFATKQDHDDASVVIVDDDSDDDDIPDIVDGDPDSDSS